MTRFDRRALFATGAAAALLAATGVSLAGTPRRGGNLRIAVPRMAAGLAPVAQAAVFESLTELTPEGILRGRLVTGWRSAQDARVWDLDLRGDVIFHDGRPMRAEDVAASLERMTLGLPGLAAVEVGDAARVRLRLTDSDPHLPIRLADPVRVVRPATDDAGGGLIGTGLYVVRHETAGGGLVAVRKETHHNGSEAGWADRVDIVPMSDPAGRAAAFADGLVDVALMPDPEAVRDCQPETCLAAGDGPVLIARSGVGLPAATRHSETRIAERFWLS